MSYDDCKDKLLRLIDYLQNVYLNNEIKTTKDSNKLLSAIEGGELLLRKNGGKLIVFNASSNWIKTKQMKIESGDTRYCTLPRGELIYTPVDPKKYLSNLGKILTQSLISCEIFHATFNDKTYSVKSLIIF